ncbi:MarR family winged helix-turn-helix transcriptional regulator [Alicyclobacillus contaminans]|uniref:MarR family winged helix-turn-helix transcriptional regulator n=1 Tax=Alicyclobacillus contaminans TaxID=392016 RepID=UPI0003FBD7AE|nr:MarR family transcriptional regulator [Alicyclobacillus contaminans]
MLDSRLRIELLMSYRRLQLQFKATARAFAARVGLTEFHLFVLSALVEHQEISLRQLAELIATSESQASVTVDELVERGCIHRVRAKEDRRRLVLRLSETGEGLLRDVFGENSPFQRMMTRVMDISEEEAKFLIHLNQRILVNLQREGVGHS